MSDSRNRLLGLAWPACVLAMIPTVVVWIMGSDVWAVAVRMEGGLAPSYTVPRGFIAALLMFCTGFLYCEAARVALVLFERHVQPRIRYAGRRVLAWVVAPWREQRALP